MIEPRKQKEAGFHDRLRGEEPKEDKRLTSNRRFYSITRKSQQFVNDFLVKNCSGKKVLDYCCGDGDTAVFLAERGAEAVGIDISPVSIRNAKEKVKNKEPKNIRFFVMDAEDLKFEDNLFDLIVCNGVLHHLDIKKAYPELARVLKPSGKIICTEPLIHNPFFQLYRKTTPHLRTKWESKHILSKEDIKLAEDYFGGVDTRFFHLVSLLAVPFRNLPGFNFVLTVLEKTDTLLLGLPFLKWWAWQIVFVLSVPRK
jgi:ubiquinone/menaquinone biosynthesis C-methylase UbiE